jgi:hypothetical protein
VETIRHFAGATSYSCPLLGWTGLIRLALREAGFATTIAETPAAAAKWLEEAAVPDVAVVDLLPEPEDAWALIAHGCAHPSRIPGDGPHLVLGCAAFVAKPCSLWQLVHIVRRVRRGERNLEAVSYAAQEL